MVYSPQKEQLGQNFCLNNSLKKSCGCAHFGSTCTKTGMIERRLGWPLSKDDVQVCEVFHIKKRKEKRRNLVAFFPLASTNMGCLRKAA